MVAGCQFGNIKMIDRGKGCNQCKNFWQFSMFKIPYPICSNENRQARLYQCPNCQSFWEESQRFAFILTEDELNKFYADYFRRTDRRIV